MLQSLSLSDCLRLFTKSKNIIIGTLSLSLIMFLQYKTIYKDRNSSEYHFNLETSIKKEQQILNYIQKDYYIKLGFENLIADWMFLKFIQYYGATQERVKTGYTLAPLYFETIIKNDPRFVNAYLYLDPATSIWAGDPSKSVSITNEGLQHITRDLKDAYFIWVYKGVNELIFLGDTDNAKKSYQQGVDYAFDQDEPYSNAVGKRVLETLSFLKTNPDSSKARSAAWSMLYYSANDLATQKKIIDTISSLGGKVTISNGQVTINFD